MVGPWGWAARMKREDLLIATAVLLGVKFEPSYERPRLKKGDPWDYSPPAADWIWAEVWLRKRGIEFTGLE